jgi:hypothetical protein
MATDYLALLRQKNEEKKRLGVPSKPGKPSKVTLHGLRGLHGTTTPNFCGAPSTRETWWRIVLATGEEKVITTSPPATLEELKALYPEAFSIEPYQRQVKRPERPLTPEEEKAILAFLASIGEEDKETIAEVMEACRCDQEAREYYLRRAKL